MTRTPSQVRHGTVRGYYGDHCRCSRCRAAQRAHTKGALDRGKQKLAERLAELAEDGCICPFTLDHGLKGNPDPECPVHFPSPLSSTSVQRGSDG